MIAIIIPYFKLNFFEVTLLSLANQTDQRFKVYISDDASAESPLDLLVKYQDKFDFSYHRFEENLGGQSLVKQWERCIARIDDEKWVMILGDDDKLSNNFVEAFYSNLNDVEKVRISVIRYASIRIDKYGTAFSQTYNNPKIEKSIDFLFRKFSGDTRSSLSEFIFSRERMECVRFKDFPLAWHSDVLAILEFSNFGLIYSINESLVFVRSSGINISSREDNLKLKNIATFKFYHYLLNKKLAYFDLNQRNILYNRLEKCFLDNKKNVNYWIKLTKMYLVRLELTRYFYFIIKVCKSVIKKLNI